jgi:hypothetical protein
MFEVREVTARKLFEAQQPHLQGRLRLDVSARCFPADTDQPIDVPCARLAIGERVVRIVQACAVEAVLLQDRAGFQQHAVPPEPDAQNLLLLMPGPGRFEGFVTYRLDRELGLDAKGPFHEPALTALAEDFFGWGQSDEAEREYDLRFRQQKLYIICKPLTPALEGLEPADDSWSGPRRLPRSR